MTPAFDPEELFARFRGGEPVDWRGGRIVSERLSAELKSIAVAGDGPAHFTLLNARVEGDVLVDSIGSNERPIGLQILGCEIIGTLRARLGHWSRLVVVNCSLFALDIPRSRVDGDLVVADVRCRGWLDAQASHIGGAISLNGSSFSGTGRDVAVDLSGSEVGLAIDAPHLNVTGRVLAGRIRVRGAVRFDGATINGPDDQPALDLSRSRIGGELRLSRSDQGRRFVAKGPVLVAAASADSLVMRGADLDGLGGPALIGDELRIAHSIDLCGLTEQGGPPFEARGPLRLVGSTVGGQFQMFDGSLESDEPRTLILDGCNIAGDLLLGHEVGGLRSKGQISAANSRIGGRMILWGVDVEAIGAALILRHCKISGELAFNDVTARGTLLLDYCDLGRLNIDGLTVRRTAPEPDRSNLPEDYAHEQDALIDLSLSQISGDARIDRLNLDGGDLRLGNARVGGRFSLVRFSIVTNSRLAILAQDTRFEDGLYIDGMAAESLTLQGDCTFMNARIARSAMLANLRIGSENSPAELNLSNAEVDGTLVLYRTAVCGEFKAYAIRVSQHLRCDGTTFRHPGQLAVDLRLAQIGGSLAFNEIPDGAEAADFLLDGELLTDEAEVGALAWTGLRLATGAKLTLTNMTVKRAIRAGLLRPQGDGDLDLSGTSAALLVDGLDGEEDPWGAGKVKLSVDTFAYAQLAYPSGRSDNSPTSIRMWRRRWLARRRDQSSSRAGRRLAKVLREQGLFEASRLLLMDAFASDGRQRPTRLEQGLSSIFGLSFGNGLSGWRALASLLTVWVIGTACTVWLNSEHLLVRSPEAGIHAARSVACGEAIDPGLYAADVMLPVLDIGQKKRCEIGLAPGGPAPEPGVPVTVLGQELQVFGTVEVARFFHSAYAALGWLVISLCIATWSGLFRRAGRD